jgi:hypothetical protein
MTLSRTSDQAVEVQRTYSRALVDGQSDLIQIWFDPAVLDRYREADGVRMIRSESIGRITRPAMWSFDFGLAPAGLDQKPDFVHLSLADLRDRLPESEREHWAAHVLTPAASVNFLKTRLAPGSCIDDGEIRDLN